MELATSVNVTKPFFKLECFSLANIFSLVLYVELFMSQAENAG